MSEFVFGKDKC